MAKRGLFWLIASLILTSLPAAVWANAASRELARRFYRQGEEQILSRQWRQALWSQEIALFLDPSLEEAKTKSERLEEALSQEAEVQYLLGLQSWQMLKQEEARLHWKLALQSVWNDSDPLKEKIERALGNETVHPEPVEGSKRGEGYNRRENKMETARAFLEAGDASQAALTLKEMARQNRNGARAQLVLANLQSSIQKGGEAQHLSQTIHQKFEMARFHFEKGKEAQFRDDWPTAWQEYNGAFALFGAEDLKPPFFKEVEEGLQKSEAMLLKDLDPKLAQYGVILSLSPSKARNPDFANVAHSLRDLMQNYPPSEKAAALLQKTYDRLQAQALPGLMQAKTVQELEGCRASTPLFEKTQVAAGFAEVPAWQEAKKWLEGCKSLK